MSSLKRPFEVASKGDEESLDSGRGKRPRMGERPTNVSHLPLANAEEEVNELKRRWPSIRECDVHDFVRIEHIVGEAQRDDFTDFGAGPAQLAALAPFHMDVKDMVDSKGYYELLIYCPPWMLVSKTFLDKLELACMGYLTDLKQRGNDQCGIFVTGLKYTRAGREPLTHQDRLAVVYVINTKDTLPKGITATPAFPTSVGPAPAAPATAPSRLARLLGFA
jgi:hypothetical protein